MSAEKKNYTEVDYTSPTGIVLGGEGGGFARTYPQTLRLRCLASDYRPGKSLNVSVAGGRPVRSPPQRHAKK